MVVVCLPRKPLLVLRRWRTAAGEMESVLDRSGSSAASTEPARVPPSRPVLYSLQ